MASRTADSPARNDIELPPAVHWPTVFMMAGVGGGLVTALLAVALIAAAQSPPAPEPAAPVAVALPPPSPRPPAPAAEPAAVAEATAADTEPPLWKPLVPAAIAVKHAEPPPDSRPNPESPPSPVAIGSTPDVRPPVAAAVPPPPPAPPVHDWWYPTPADYLLFEDLQRYTHTADLDAVDGTAAKLLGKAAEASRNADEKPRPAAPSATALLPGPDESLVNLIARRPDLSGLPVLGKSECTTAEKTARGIQEVSRALRRLQSRLPARSAPFHYGSASPHEYDLAADYDSMAAGRRNSQLITFLTDQKDWLKEEYASVLTQMLQAEDVPVRLHLTKMLASIKGQSAGVALARQAIFDLSPEVRVAAVQALKDRPHEECRDTLLAGFRHPWPRVAEHAAEAIATLDDRDAAKGLEAMLDLPDPSGPTLREEKWVVPELVKVNHQRNCLLCHAPSSDPNDLVRGLVPRRDQPLPVEYYARSKGEFVHADVTYLRQDFSVMERVGPHGEWPELQRFDYMVRFRELTDQELIDLADCGLETGRPNPQREAVRFALRSLTEKDAAAAAKDWMDYLSRQCPSFDDDPGGKAP